MLESPRRMFMAQPRVFSGVQPSGDLHLGNYLGAIVNWVRLQNEKDNIFCVVDLHAITVSQDPVILKKRVIETAKVLLAAGIKPKESALFVQSERPEHSELAWILNCFTPFGELARMTQFKDKAQKQENFSVGLFDYPALMAADILLYDTDEVPVGEDQKQHVEITRDIAERMNKKFGKIFTVPQPIITKSGARIMSLVDPTVKMSKSDPNTSSYILLRDKPEDIEKKIARATTDSGNKIKFDLAEKPGISNLLNILSVITEKPMSELEKSFVNQNYGQFKKATAETIIEFLKPLQSKLAELDSNEEFVRQILGEGAEKVAPRAQVTLKRVKTAVGLGL
jgi:tryptophanyl-tRNA synthetase